MPRIALTALVLLTLATTSCEGQTRKPQKGDGVDEASWPQFGGVHRDHVSRQKGILKAWPEGGPTLLWSIEGAGQGYSSLAVVEETIYTLGNVEDKECLLAYHLSDGHELWKAELGPATRLSAGDGPRGTPTVSGDFVYALGGDGQLACVDRSNGKIKWSGNILKEYNASNISWGICESVLIDGNNVICTPGGRGATMVALNKNTGKEIWRSQVEGDEQAGYASSVLTTIGGVKQLVQFTSRGTIGVNAKDGKFLWRENSAANGTANCSQPVVYENMIFSSSGYGTGAAMVVLNGSGRNLKPELAYTSKEMQSHHGGMFQIDGYLYGSSDPGVLRCIEIKTGKVQWQDRSVGKGSVTCADGMIILRSEGGPVALVDATPTGFHERGRFDQPNRSDHASWSYPVVAYGRLFLRDQDRIFCYDIRAEKE